MNDPESLGQTPYLQTMRALLAKDWRLFRLPLSALVAVGLGCYPITVAAVLGGSEANAAYYLFNAAMLACEVTAVLASVFGGAALTGERADHTADFLNTLPVTRSQIIVSKWMVCMIMVGASLGLHSLVALIFWRLETSGSRATLALPIWVQRAYGPAWSLAAYWESASAFAAACIISLFGVAWGLSAFTKSGPICACASIAVTIATVVLAKNGLGDPRLVGAWEAAYRLALPPAAIGLSSLVAGTLYYLRRVAP